IAVDAVAFVSCPAVAQHADSSISVRGDSVSVHLVDADLRAAVESLAPFLDRPVAFGSAVPGARVTLETPRPVPRGDVLGLLTGLLASQNLQLARDSTLYRVEAKAPVPAAVSAPNAASSGAGVQLFIIHLRHARAADVAATVNALYGRASALGEPAAGRPTTLDQQLQSTQIPPVGAQGAAIASVVGRNATLSGDVTIVPDARSNSLLIRASQSDFDLITAAVSALDTRPLQVLIEVIIAEVQRDRSLAFGVDATLPPTRVGSSKTVVNGS